jgi:tetratricopeptide (TPR) repeat protein
MDALIVAAAISVTLALSACTTSSDKKNLDSDDNVILDGERVKKEKDPQDELTRLPVSLWSPGQRSSTAGYYFMAAETIALREKDPKKALPLFETAYNLDPNPFLGGKMVAAKAMAGDRSEALLDARKMVLLYPHDADLRFFYGGMLASGRDFDAATEQLEKCIDLDPLHEAAYFELIGVYQTRGDQAKALVVAKDLVKHIPSSVAGWSQLSRLYLASGRYQDALVPARRAWEMQSSNPQLTQIYAVTLQLNGRTKQAVQMYEQLFRLDPTDSELSSRMVALYRELGNLDSALKLLSAVESQDDRDRPGVTIQKAIILWELQRNKEALDLLEGLLRRHPESDRVKYLTAFGAERTEDFDRSLELYRGVPESSSLKFDADVRILLILKQQKAWDEVLDLGQAITEKAQATWETVALVAGVFAEGEKVKQALRTTEDGLKRFPDQPRLLFLKGVYQERLGEREACIATMREVLRIEPTNSSALNYLGYLFAERGENLEESEKLIRKALELKPDDGFYTDSLGWVYYQRKDFKKALEILERASSLEPNEGVIHEHVADALLKLGQKKAAAQRLERALKGELEPKDRERVLKKLKDLGG